MLSFLSSYVLALKCRKAVLLSSGLESVRKSAVCLNSFIHFIVMSCVVTSLALSFSSAVFQFQPLQATRITIAFTGLTNLVIGCYFINFKSKILMKLKQGSQMMSSVNRSKTERLDMLKRSSYFLALSAIFMFLTVALLTIETIGFATGNFSVTWWSRGLGQISTSMIGLLQLCSFRDASRLECCLCRSRQGQSASVFSQKLPQSQK